MKRKREKNGREGRNEKKREESEGERTKYLSNSHLLLVALLWINRFDRFRSIQRTHTDTQTPTMTPTTTIVELVAL